MSYFRFFVTRVFKLLMWGGIVSVVWVVFSCDEFCEESNRTAVVINFYDADDTSVRIKVTIKGIENDSVLYPNVPIYGREDLLQVLLPVNPSADIMSFSIKNDTFPADTIIIQYTRHNGFISSECGCVTYAEIQETPEMTENFFKRLDVANPNVTTVSYRQGVINAENIRIYY